MLKQPDSAGRKSIKLIIVVTFAVMVMLLLVAHLSSGNSPFAISLRQTPSEQAQSGEVINGITVPPDPSPSVNNSTLAGVDMNKNGVRDDVERMIAKKVSSQSEFDNLIQAAVEYQRVVVSGFDSKDAADVYMRKLACIEQKAIKLQPDDIKVATMNTPARRSSFIYAVTNIAWQPIDVKSIVCK